MSGFDSVPKGFISVRDDEFNKTFQADREKISSWIGGIFQQNLFDDKLSISHAQLTNWVGGYSMRAIASTSYRSWTFDDNKNRVLWERLIWRIVHIYPLGFLITRYKYYISETRGSWNPSFQSLESYSKNSAIWLDVSNRSINGGPVSLSMYLKIFGDDIGFSDQASIMQAVCDVFSHSPNTDNPLYAALRRAIKSTILRNPYPLPYFWEDFLLHLYSSIPSELAHISTVSFNNGNVEDFNLAELLKENSPTNTKPTLNEANTNINEEQEVKNDIIKDFEVNFKVMCDKLASGEFKANQKGALLHKVDNFYFMVHPMWLEKLVPYMPESIKENYITELLDTLIVNKKIAIYSAKINVKNNGFPIKLACLNPKVADTLPANIIALQNNDIISIDQLIK